jgi:hypothetical protein
MHACLLNGSEFVAGNIVEVDPLHRQQLPCSKGKYSKLSPNSRKKKSTYTTISKWIRFIASSSPK